MMNGSGLMARGLPHTTYRCKGSRSDSNLLENSADAGIVGVLNGQKPVGAGGEFSELKINILRL